MSCTGKEGNAIGYDKLEITHPNAWTEDFTIPVLKELTSLGATLTLSLEFALITEDRILERLLIIKEVKAENCCLISDYGQVYSASPVEGLRTYCYN